MSFIPHYLHTIINVWLTGSPELLFLHALSMSVCLAGPLVMLISSCYLWVGATKY